MYWPGFGSCKPVLPKTLIFKLRHEMILGLDEDVDLEVSEYVLLHVLEQNGPTIEHDVMENKFSLL